MFLNLVAKANIPQDPKNPLFSRSGGNCSPGEISTYAFYNGGINYCFSIEFS
jgi:hypothetical protein